MRLENYLSSIKTGRIIRRTVRRNKLILLCDLGGDYMDVLGRLTEPSRLTGLAHLRYKLYVFSTLR